MSDLGGMTILITGASRGIGAATARACASAGARLVLHASAPSEAARAVERETRGASEGFIYQDLSESGAGQALFDDALAASGGRIDCVVNNAGIYVPSPLDMAHSDDWHSGWQTTLAVNVIAPADIVRASVTHFRLKGGGRIINIASRAGHRGDGPDHAAYAASKGAMLAMTKTWARALAGEAIEFYAIAPGWVETRMAPEDIEARKSAIADIPLGRVAAPSEIAAMVTLLASGQCPSAVGSTIDINGASYVR